MPKLDVSWHAGYSRHSQQMTPSSCNFCPLTFNFRLELRFGAAPDEAGSMARRKAWTLKLQRYRDSLCCDVVELENKMPTMRGTWDLGHLYLLVGQSAGDPKMIESMVLTIPKDCVLWTIWLKPPSLSDVSHTCAKWRLYKNQKAYAYRSTMLLPVVWGPKFKVSIEPYHT